jgi:hypothetical protein
MVRSSNRSIVRPFVRPNNLFPAVMLPKFRTFVSSIVHRSFIVPIHRSSFVHSPYSSFFQIIFVMLLCCRNSDRSFVRSFDRSSVRSSFVHRHYSSFIVRSYDYSPSLSTITIYRYYSSSLLFIDTIPHRYYLLLLFDDTIHYCYYSSLLFIDDIYGPFSSSLFIISIHRYYSSIIRSTQISTTHSSCCPVYLRPARPIFQSYELW